MTTGLDLVTSAMRKIGALTKSEAPSSDEAVDGLEIINDLISAWSNDSMKIYARSLESFSLTASDGTYTIGTSADFNTSRPVQIIKGYIRSGTVDYPVDVKSDEDFALISQKSQTGRVRYLNYDYGYSTGTIKLYPVPDSAYTLFLLMEKELSSLTSAGNVSFPPGWERALIYNSAVEMAPEYGIETPKEVVAIAQESKASIQRAIIKNKSMDVPTNLGARNNVYAGWE